MAADTIYVAPTPAYVAPTPAYVAPTPAYAAPTPADAFTWAPSVPAAADDRIYAGWTAASGQAPNAQYVGDNGTGSVPVIVDQRANGGIM